MLVRSLPVLAAAALLAACADAPTGTAERPSLIINGTPTGSSFGSVGALLFDFDRNGRIDGDDQDCTGSLISPTVFLTAAHCVEFFPPGSQLYVSFEPDLYAIRRAIPATGYAYDPQYAHDQSDPHDIAVVFLPSSATRGLTPYKLPTAGLLDALNARGALNDELFINVGYGTSAGRTGVPSFGYDGVRKSSLSEFMGLKPYWLGLLMNTAATDLGGDCYGDSGGPKFRQSDPTTVVAITVTGDFPCRSTSWDYRTDTPTARAFLSQYVKLP